MLHCNSALRPGGVGAVEKTQVIENTLFIFYLFGF